MTPGGRVQVLDVADRPSVQRIDTRSGAQPPFHVLMLHEAALPDVELRAQEAGPKGLRVEPLVVSLRHEGQETVEDPLVGLARARPQPRKPLPRLWAQVDGGRHTPVFRDRGIYEGLRGMRETRCPARTPSA